MRTLLVGLFLKSLRPLCNLFDHAHMKSVRIVHRAVRPERGRPHRLEPHVVDTLRALRGPGESYSDVILRVAAGERCS